MSLEEDPIYGVWADEKSEPSDTKPVMEAVAADDWSNGLFKMSTSGMYKVSVGAVDLGLHPRAERIKEFQDRLDRLANTLNKGMYLTVADSIEENGMLKTRFFNGNSISFMAVDELSIDVPKHEKDNHKQKSRFKNQKGPKQTKWSVRRKL